jgi:hypothetical protein
MTEIQARLCVRDEHWTQSSETAEKGDVKGGSKNHKIG